jgi:predicted outer membrane protein
VFHTVALLLLANAPPDQTTLPRHPDPDPVEQHAQRDGTPTDPWFDRAFVATDDPAFILSAVENVRQGTLDAESAAKSLDRPELVSVAQKIGKQNEATSKRLEQIARTKGWRLPEQNPARATTTTTENAGTNGSVSTGPRANANFILNQLSFHQNTVAQYRAQIAGKGDAELKRVLKEALPGYQQNLDLLLTLKP